MGMLQLKDLNDDELQAEVDNYTTKFELESMLSTKSKHLSGGMKRKLSVAIALIGKSKVRISHHVDSVFGGININLSSRSTIPTIHVSYI